MFAFVSPLLQGLFMATFNKVLVNDRINLWDINSGQISFSKPIVRID